MYWVFSNEKQLSMTKPKLFYRPLPQEATLQPCERKPGNFTNKVYTLNVLNRRF